MLRTHSSRAILLILALALSGCALATEVYPTPRPQDLPVGIDEGLIRPDWDGGHPLRYFAYLMNPLGVVGDLLINQPFYQLAALEPEFFGFTNQDELYRRSFQKQRYSWDTFYYQFQQWQNERASR